jgi:predicted nucleotidyltransferase
VTAGLRPALPIHHPPQPSGGTVGHDAALAKNRINLQIPIVRISEHTCQTIKNHVARMAPGSECYLFGSRTIDTAKGGDIDILVITPGRVPLSHVSRMRRLILNQIGEQKLDIVHFPIASNHPFKRAALENAIKL